MIAQRPAVSQTLGSRNAPSGRKRSGASGVTDGPYRPAPTAQRQIPAAERVWSQRYNFRHGRFRWEESSCGMRRDTIARRGDGRAEITSDANADELSRYARVERMNRNSRSDVTKVLITGKGSTGSTAWHCIGFSMMSGRRQ